MQGTAGCGVAAQAALPDLDWDRLDYLGWRDRKAPLLAYVVVPGTAPNGAPAAVLLRATDPAGRRGDTVGTLLCTELACSRNVRRRPPRPDATTPS